MRTLAVALLAALPAAAAAGPLARSTPHEAPQTPAVSAPDAKSGGWIDTRAVQARLASGAVVVRSLVDGRRSRATVDAAIRIEAGARVIWPLITQCKFAGWLIPGLKRCRTLETAPDGSWADIEHDIKYSMFIPMVHSVFRADFHPPYRMDFHRIGGSLKYEVGSWSLTPGADGTTTVEYRVSLEPGFWMPRFIERRMLRKQLPAALRALRDHAERLASSGAAAPSPRA